MRLVRGDANVCSIDYQYSEPHPFNTETKRHKAIKAQRLWSYVAAFIDRLSHKCLPGLLLVFIKFVESCHPLVVLLLVVQMRRLKTSMAPSCDNFWNDITCAQSTHTVNAGQSKLHVVTRCYVHPSRAFRLRRTCRLRHHTPLPCRCFETQRSQFLVESCQALETLSHPTHPRPQATVQHQKRKRWYAKLTPQRQARQPRKPLYIFFARNFGSDSLQFLSNNFWQWWTLTLFSVWEKCLTNWLNETGKPTFFFVSWTHLRNSKEGHLGNPEWPFGTPRGGHCWLGWPAAKMQAGRAASSHWNGEWWSGVVNYGKLV